jgi:hypothetical protein
VPLSKITSIYVCVTSAYGAVRGKLQDRLHLIPSYSEFFDQFVYAHFLEVFKHRSNWCSRPAKHPCAASFAGNVLDRVAL